jgi:FNIP Repeat
LAIAAEGLERAHYNVPLDHLPSSLASLYMALQMSTHPVDHLPLSLKELYLTFGKGGKYHFNLDHLPNLQVLAIYGDVPHPMHLPTSLTTFMEGLPCMQNTNNTSTKYNQIELWPPILCLPSKNYDSFWLWWSAHSIKHHHVLMVCHNLFYPFTSVATSTKRYNLPPNLTEIHFGTNFNQCIDFLPSSITNICCGFYFNQPIDHLPPNLSKLTLSNNFNHPVDHLPLSLKKLILGNKFNQPVNFLPNSLVHLQFGDSFNQPIDHLPLKLCFGRIFAHPLTSLHSSVH